MARRRKKKKQAPYITTDYFINDEPQKGKIEYVPNSRIKIGSGEYKATSTVRGGYRYFQDGDVIVRIPERKWQELIAKTVTIEDIWR